MPHCDVAIVGAGIIGLASALEVRQRLPKARILVLDKAPQVAAHQSGHNSGVIHAGVYYAPGSLKARFCRQGVQATRDFCREHAIAFDTCGKLIVATDEREVQALGHLEARARANGLRIEAVDDPALQRMEPHIRGLSGLFSPDTGIVDYGHMSAKMAELARAQGIQLQLGCAVLGGQESAEGLHLRTAQGSIDADKALFCAGLHSDRLLRAFGQVPPYRIVPFRGEYFQLAHQPPDLVRHLIYPVPDPQRPFLGVHITRKLDGRFTVGPNAVLAFAREGYRRRDINLRDLSQTLTDRAFWRLLSAHFKPAISELVDSLWRRRYLARVRRYCPKIQLRDLHPYPSGVRAQAVADDGRLIDDFLFVHTPHSLHVGNAPSPAATSAFPIARHIVAQLLD